MLPRRRVSSYFLSEEVVAGAAEDATPAAGAAGVALSAVVDFVAESLLALAPSPEVFGLALP